MATEKYKSGDLVLAEINARKTPLFIAGILQESEKSVPPSWETEGTQTWELLHCPWAFHTYQYRSPYEDQILVSEDNILCPLGSYMESGVEGFLKDLIRRGPHQGTPETKFKFGNPRRGDLVLLIDSDEYNPEKLSFGVGRFSVELRRVEGYPDPCPGNLLLCRNHLRQSSCDVYVQNWVIPIRHDELERAIWNYEGRGGRWER